MTHTVDTDVNIYCKHLLFSDFLSQTKQIIKITFLWFFKEQNRKLYRIFIANNISEQNN